MSDGLFCECHMPLVWHAESLAPHVRQARMQEAALLLAALNQIEGTHELESSGTENRRLDRIEAKLDLTLHLLARTLNTEPMPESRIVQLSPVGAQWQDPAPPDQGTILVLDLRPSEALPLSLKLSAIALEPLSGSARVRFEGLTETLDEALYQFVFRRHRQAIRARTV
jgi:hypothetical protein